MKFLLFLSVWPAIVKVITIAIWIKVINHFKAKFYLMAEMEKSGLDEITCHVGSVFLPSGCQEAESQTFSPHGVCGWGWPGLLRLGVSSAPCPIYKLRSSL